MTKYVDDDIELWHFRVWKLLIRIIFDNVCFIQRNELIISKNIVRFVKKNAFIIDYIFHCDKIIFIERDHRKNATKFEKIRIILQIIFEINYLKLHDYKNVIHDVKFYELFFVENVIIEFFVKTIQRRILIEMNKKYDDNEQNEQSFFDDIYFIRKIVSDDEIKSFWMMHQTFDELKIQHFDRKYVKKVFDKSHVSFSYFLFIDEFEIHKNIYRFLKIFYLISTALFYKKRRKIVNIFTFILNSHETKIKNIVEIIHKSIQKLNACINMNFNEFTKKVCAFNIIFFENMF